MWLEMKVNTGHEPRCLRSVFCEAESAKTRTAEDSLALGKDTPEDSFPEVGVAICHREELPRSLEYQGLKFWHRWARAQLSVKS